MQRPKSLARLAAIVMVHVVVGLSIGGGVAAQYGLHFGAPGGAVVVGEPGLPGALQQLSVECWVKTGTVVRNPVRLISRWQEDPEAIDRGTFHLSFTSTNRLVFGVRNQDGKGEMVAGRAMWKDGKWHHVAGTWDGSQLAIFLDGKNVGEKEVADFGALGDSKLPLTFGPIAVGKKKRPPVFEGYLGGIRIFDVSRSALVIRESLKEPELDPVGLVAHYPLRAREPSSVVADMTGSGPDGEVSDALARTGWYCTSMWDGLASNNIDLGCIAVGSSPANLNEAQPNSRDRKILVSDDKRAIPGVLWQDSRSREIYITWVDPGTGLSESHALEGKVGGQAIGILAAGTTDPQGNVYYLVYQESPNGRSEDVPLLATIFKADAKGGPLVSSTIDNTRKAFNVWSFGRRGHGNMRFSKGVLGLILPRTMYRSRDGLRHQAAIAVSFSAKTLELMRNLGTTSSHSKGNILSVNAKGEFLGIDLGDNYPRGVHLHKFTATNKSSAVVFTYKTAHGTKARNGSPPYAEISAGGRQFYKWSNDNSTYSELGAVIEGRKSYSVLFATDQSLDGRVLDNSRAFRNCDDPRNLAMLRVVKRFQKGGRGSVVSDSLMVGLPKGNASEEGGFFNFNGGWSKQRVTGVIWLTQYKQGESAHAPQATPTADGGALVLWEKSGRNGNSLQAMKMNKRGQMSPAVDLGVAVRLNRQDRLLNLGGRIYLLASGGGEGFRLYFVRDES